MWHLLMAHQQESFSPLLPSKVSLAAQAAWSFLSTPEPCGPPIYFRTSWPSSFSSEPHSSPSLWLPRLGLNPSAHLPLQPHFGLLLQSVTPASIPIFFQLYWAAIVSPGRCGPMAWSQSSPSSHAGPVTRGSCFPVPSAPIPLAHSMPTAI